MIGSWEEAEEAFDDWLDAEGEQVTIAGMEFLRSTLLKRADPIAYRCILLDFLDADGVDTDELAGYPSV